MDELASFFTEDPLFMEDNLITDLPDIFGVAKNHPNIRSKNQMASNFVRNYSEPSFHQNKLLSVLHPSNSFPSKTSLPLDLPPEPEEGNIEYKLKLVNPTNDRLEHLMTQMKWRLNEGGGQAIYRLGVNDSGIVNGLTASEMAASLSTVCNMANRLGVDLRLLRECTITTSIPTSELSPLEITNPSIRFQRKAVELHLKWKMPVNQGLPDMRVAMLGGMDVGKSTLIGILTDGEMDNGRGRARLNLFRHLHEVQSGRTSSLSSELIGFDISGRLVNRRRSQGKLNKRTVDEVIRDSHQLITFIDLAGHTRYQRTTLSGLTTFQPAFCLLVISATSGLTPEGFSHARLATALNIPLVVVFSKLDLIYDAARPRKIVVSTAASIASEREEEIDGLADITSNILKELKTIKYYNCKGCKPKMLELSREDPPVFAVSCVSGYGLGRLLNFLALASSSAKYSNSVAATSSSSSPDDPPNGEQDALVECWITKVFNQVPGVDYPVLEVLVKSGEVYEDQPLWLGPDEKGEFIRIHVVELRHNRHPHHVLHQGQLGSLVVVAVSQVDPIILLPRRGMVLLNAEPFRSVESNVNPSIAVCWSFCISNITLLPSNNGVVCLQPNTTVGIHVGNVLQYARILETSISPDKLTHFSDCSKADLDSVILELTSSHTVVVAFLCQPGFLKLGRQVVISVNNVAKAVGLVSAFKDAIFVFKLPSRQPQTAPEQLIPETTSSDTPWNSISNINTDPPASYDSLLRQVGIDPEGSHNIFTNEPPLPPQLVASENTVDLMPRFKRRQRNSKRRRKVLEHPSTMTASTSDMTSSSTTVNSTCNERIALLAENGPNRATFETGLLMGNSNFQAHDNKPNFPAKRRHRRKKRYRN